MLNRVSAFPGIAVLAIAALSIGNIARAETLLVERVQQERGIPLPTRGMSMTQVEKQFGVPASKLTPAGGDAPLHPTINRWAYDSFTVYFERDHVISSVVNRISSNEIGPKGATPQ